MQKWKFIYSSIFRLSMMVVLVCYLMGISYGQTSPSLMQLDTFSPERHSGEAFAEAIRTTREHIIKAGKYQAILSTNSYLDSLAHYSFKEKFYLREAYARHARDLDKYISDVKTAAYYYQQAHDLLSDEELQNDPWIWFVENPLGIAYNQLGDFEKSIQIYQRGIHALKHQDNPKYLSRMYANLGTAYRTKGDSIEAIASFHHGIKIAQSIKFSQGEIVNYLYLIQSKLNSYNSRDSIKFLLAHANILIHQSKSLARYKPLLLGLEALYFTQSERHTEAIQKYQEEINELDKIYPHRQRREYAKEFNLIAEEYTAIGKLDSSRHYLFRAIQCLVPTTQQMLLPVKFIYRENTFQEIYSSLATYYMKKYEQNQSIILLDSAIRAHDLAILAFKQLRENYAMNESKFISTSTHREHIDKIIEILYEKQVRGDQISDRTLLHYFDQSKSIVLNERLSQHREFANLPDSLKQVYVSNKFQIANLRHASNQELEIDNRRIIELSEINNAILPIAEPAQESLEDPFINFLLTPNYMYALDNFDSGLLFSRIAKTQQAKLILNSFYSLLTDSRSDIAIVNQTSSQVYQMLLGHINRLPSAFSVIPDGILNSIPFDVLSFDSQYLLFDHEITNRLSMSVSSQGGSTNAGVYCMAPDYGESNELIALNRMDIYPLKYIEQELDAITTNYPKSIVSRSIEIDDLVDVFQHNKIFHFAGHARADNLMGRLFLDKEKNTISGEQLASIPSNLDLAVLSACETGHGEVKYGEGTMSLARSFIEGGTRNVVNTLWTVNDQSTAMLMRHFYSRLQDKKSPIAALRQAKVDYLNLAQGRDRHPYFWAGFVLTTVESTHTNYNSLQTVAILIFITIISGLVYYLFTNKQ